MNTDKKRNEEEHVAIISLTYTVTTQGDPRDDVRKLLLHELKGLESKIHNTAIARLFDIQADLSSVLRFNGSTSFSIDSLEEEE